MRLVSLTVGVLFSFSALAEISPDVALKAQLEGYSMATAKAAEEVNNINKDIAGLNKRLEQEQKELKKYNLAISSGQYFDKDTALVEKKAKEYQADIDSLQKKLEAQQAALTKAQTSFETNKAVVDRTAKEMAAANSSSANASTASASSSASSGAASQAPDKAAFNDLRTEMNVMKANQSRMDVEHKIDQGKLALSAADQKLNELERSVDTSKIGTYFKDKIGKLINSQLMCEGVQRCVRGKAPMPVAPEKLKEIFGNVPDSETRSEYYYQMRNKSNPAGTQGAQ